MQTACCVPIHQAENFKDIILLNRLNTRLITQYLHYQNSDPVEIPFISYYKPAFQKSNNSDFSKLHFTDSDLTTYFIT